MSSLIQAIIERLYLPKKAEKGKVYLPKSIAMIGAVSAVLFLIPTLITAFSDEPIWIPIAFLCFSLLGASLIVAFINCRIYYDEKSFVSKNFLGIKRRYTYDQITGIRENIHESYLYVGKRKVMVDGMAIGSLEFLSFVRKQYRKCHNGKYPPVIRKNNDIFRGNVAEPAGFIFAFILMGLFIVGFGIFMAWMIFCPFSANNTLQKQVAFTEYERQEEALVLTTADRQIYKIEFKDQAFDDAEIRALCDGKTQVTVHYKEIKPEDEADYGSVKALIRDGKELLRFEETSRWQREEMWPLIFFPIGFAVFWGSLVAATIIVGRNPHKFKPWVIRLFFKDGYIRY